MALLADNLPVNPVPTERGRGRPSSLRLGSWSRRAAFLGLCFALCFATFGAAPEPPKGEAEVKANYLYLFTKYVEWPAGALAAADQPIVIGVLGDEATADALDGREAGRTTQGGRKVSVVRVRRPADLAGCHVIFVGKAERRSLREVTEGVRDQPALLVCETEAQFNQGAMIKFVLVGENLRFEVKLEPVERVGLSIQSGMLASANRVWRKARSSLEPP